jgi:hypothetical protein
MSHACNPSYSAGRDRKIMIGGKPKQKLGRACLLNKPGMVVHAYISSYWGEEAEASCLRPAWAKST